MNRFPVRRCIGAVLVLALVPLYAASRVSTKVRIRLVDMAGVDERLRVESEAIVRAIFRTSCIDVEFTDSLVPDGFSLQILSGHPKHVAADATGAAVLVPSRHPGDSYAAVWLDEVESAARSLEAPVAEVLGASMAHEIGHLVLHSSQHSRTGLMSRRLDRRQILLLERGELLF